MYTLDSIQALVASLETRRQPEAALTDEARAAFTEADHAAHQLELLLRQHTAAAAQLSAAIRRQGDLDQQLAASQAELGRLGFMQLGKKMMIRAEQDNIRKKLDTNRQLQENLQQQHLALTAQVSAAEVALEACLARLDTLPVMQEQKADPAPAQPEPTAPVKAADPAPAAPAIPVSQPAAPKAAPAVPAKPRASRAPSTPRVSAQAPLEEQIARFMARLEPLYPEHQVFALDSISSELRNRLKLLVKRGGYADADAFLRAQGWSLITGAEGRKLRAGKYCIPGQEPEVIRPLVQSVLRRLEEHYPDHTIPQSLQQQHKSLSQDVSGLYQWLGYPSAADMLKAYGYTYQVSAGGRPATNADALLDTLRKACADGPKPRSIAQIMKEHPELAHGLKTLQNQAPARFGMPLRQYLVAQGLMESKEAPTN